MILEVAILKIKPNLNQKFEQAFEQAVSIIAATPRYIEHDLQIMFRGKQSIYIVG